LFLCEKDPVRTRGVKRAGMRNIISIPSVARSPIRVSIDEGSKWTVAFKGKLSLRDRHKEIHVRSMTGRKSASTGKITRDMHVERRAQRGRHMWNGRRSIRLGPDGRWN
jgi:hypothetical protein